MESRWEFTAPQFVDFAAIDLDDDMEEDKFFDVNNETRWCLILSLSGWFVLRCVFFLTVTPLKVLSARLDSLM